MSRRRQKCSTPSGELPIGTLNCLPAGGSTNVPNVRDSNFPVVCRYQTKQPIGRLLLSQSSSADLACQRRQSRVEVAPFR